MNTRMLTLAVVLGLSGVVAAGPNVAVGVTIGGPPVPYYRAYGPPPGFFGPPVGYWRPYPPAYLYPPPYYGWGVAVPVVATPVVVVERPRTVVVEAPPVVQYQPAPTPAPAPATSAYPPAGGSNPLPLPASSLPLPPPPALYYPRQVVP